MNLLSGMQSTRRRVEKMKRPITKGMWSSLKNNDWQQPKPNSVSTGYTSNLVKVLESKLEITV